MFQVQCLSIHPSIHSSISHIKTIHPLIHPSSNRLIFFLNQFQAYLISSIMAHKENCIAIPKDSDRSLCRTCAIDVDKIDEWDSMHRFSNLIRVFQSTHSATENAKALGWTVSSVEPSKFFSRMRATLQATLSVGRSVGPLLSQSVGRSVGRCSRITKLMAIGLIYTDYRLISFNILFQLPYLMTNYPFFDYLYLCSSERIKSVLWAAKKKSNQQRHGSVYERGFEAQEGKKIA